MFKLWLTYEIWVNKTEISTTITINTVFRFYSKYTLLKITFCFVFIFFSYAILFFVVAQ